VPTYKQISLTVLECKALWLIADIGYHTPNTSLDDDADLQAAADRALDKVWRAEKGMTRKGHPPGDNIGPRGPGLDLRRKAS
jgi:hypothetical protein